MVEDLHVMPGCDTNRTHSEVTSVNTFGHTLVQKLCSSDFAIRSVETVHTVEETVNVRDETFALVDG